MTDPLVGRWHRITDTACAREYADTLVFDANGTYLGVTDPPGRFVWWDAGGWQRVAADAVRISTANDAEIVYRAVIADGIVRFIDPAGCEIAYRAAAR